MQEKSVYKSIHDVLNSAAGPTSCEEIDTSKGATYSLAILQMCDI